MTKQTGISNIFEKISIFLMYFSKKSVTLDFGFFFWQISTFQEDSGAIVYGM